MGTNRSLTSPLRVGCLLAACAGTMLAQRPLTLSTGTITLPASSISGPGDAGVRAHTNIQILGSGRAFTGTPSVGPPFGPGAYYETPASLACIYGLQPAVPGCNPYTALTNPSGGGKAIAIVDAYDNPNAVADLQTFNGQFGVAPLNPNSAVVFYAPPGGATPGSCTGPATRPPSAAGTGWDVEASLDLQYTHAMAPLADLYLVEAQSDSLADLFCAVSIANSMVKAAGGGEVTMSWGFGEFASETSFDPVFTTPGVVYFASAGDGPGTLYPSVSPNVVAVGGTTLSTNPANGNFLFENTWQSTGGGLSIFEARPAYQNGIIALVGSQRGVPDVSANANTNTGVWVFNSSFIGIPVWFIAGGTSASSPIWAGITNAAGGFAASSVAELTELYGHPVGAFNDITFGVCGPFQGYEAAPGWDLCSGLGSPHTYAGK